MIELTLKVECGALRSGVWVAAGLTRDSGAPLTRCSDCKGAHQMHMTTPIARLDVEQAEARIAWVSQARCKEVDPDQLFVRGAAQRKAATICRHCPVLMQCGADALDNRVEFGVWGGMTERQRRALLKQHPEVTSWADFFQAQRQHQVAM
ncbi:putative transcriptional regulator (modular protein) [Nocardia cyriacigeorgica GUH-2]|uniref:Transcriptional regulator WhiB n=7 Tax=Nocardia TaxID=1817 RepID=H6R9S8_NOCCG|nr:putative transcriptional regulator (modular protein) [Nocardia cyriacigeorgica GUH-2]